jgi:uncharacterized protein YebE (UPF0316 family)
MDPTGFDYISYVVIPLLIFLARVVDVSLGTVRIIFISKGFNKLAPFIGFFEVFIWIVAISRVMQNLDNWICYVAYAGGFATGNYIGMKLDEKLALGYELIRVITKTEAYQLINVLRDKGYGTTSVKAYGSEGEVAVIYIIINRKKMKKVLEIIKNHNPKAFYTIEDIRFVNRDLDAWQTVGLATKRK